MTAFGWSMVDAVSQLLEREEREAVRGDLAECGEGPGQALLDVLGWWCGDTYSIGRVGGHGLRRLALHCRARCCCWGYRFRLVRRISGC